MMRRILKLFRARCETLQGLFDSSRVFNQINASFLTGPDQTAQAGAAYQANPEHIHDFPVNVKMVKCELNSRKLLEVPDSSELREADHLGLFPKHDAIEYRNDHGEICYSVLDPQRIRLLTKERE